MRIVNILSKEDIKVEVEKAVKVMNTNNIPEFSNLWKKIRMLEERIKILEQRK